MNGLKSRSGPAAIGIVMNGNKKLTKIWKRVWITIMALAGTGAILAVLWYNGVFLPGWIAWKDRKIQQGEYEILLDSRTVKVLYDGTVIWTSPKGVKVQDVLSCDADNDGREELILLCWKIGRYGKYRPFWVEKDEKKWSQHIFVWSIGKR